MLKQVHNFRESGILHKSKASATVAMPLGVRKLATLETVLSTAKYLFSKRI